MIPIQKKVLNAAVPGFSFRNRFASLALRNVTDLNRLMTTLLRSPRSKRKAHEQVLSLPTRVIKKEKRPRRQMAARAEPSQEVIQHLADLRLSISSQSSPLPRRVVFHPTTLTK